MEEALGLSFGDREELEKIADEWMVKLDLASMTFADFYLPLVLAGKPWRRKGKASRASCTFFSNRR